MITARLFLNIFVVIIASLIFYCNGANIPTVNYSYFKYRFADKTLPVELRVAYADSLMFYFPESTNKLLTETAKICYEAGKIDEALDYISHRIALGLSNTSINEKCEVMSLASKIFSKSGDFIRSAAIADSLLSIPKPDSLLIKDLETYELLFDMNVYDIKVATKFVDKAETLYSKALQKGINQKYTDPMKISVTFLKMRRAWYTDSIDKVMEYSMILEKSKLSPQQRASIFNTRGLISMHLGDTLEGQKYFEKVLALHPITDFQHPALMNLAYLFNQTKQFSNTIDTINKYYTHIIQTNDIFSATVLKLKAEAMGNKGDFKQAYNVLDSSFNILDSLFINSCVNRSVYEMETNALNNNVIYSKRIIDLTNKKLYTALIVIIVLLVVIGIITSKSRKSRLIQLTTCKNYEEKVTDLEQVIASKESEIEILSRELLGKTMKVDHFNDILSEVDKTIGKKGAISSENALKLRNILKAIGREEQTWQSFSYHFENTDKNFTLELQKRHPDLTAGDKRLISYIMMNLTSKEIAELTNKSIRSVDSARYRLGKKLGLDSGTTLSSYLNSIVNPLHDNDSIPLSENNEVNDEVIEQ